MKKKLLIAVLLLALIGGAVLAVKHKRAQVAERPAAGIPPVVVEARKLALGPVTLSLPVSVEVVAAREAVLASRFSANITELTRLEGDRFKKGDVLVRLDLAQAEADRLRAEAELARVRLQETGLAADLAAARSAYKAEQERYQRQEALLAIGGVALEQVQAGQAALEAARARETAASNAVKSYRALLQASEAQVAAARENLRYGVITAPFDGVVTQRLAQPGDLATPGKPLLKVMDLSAGVRLLVNVPDGLHPKTLHIGGEALPLTPWPEAVGQGMARFEAKSNPPLSPNPSPRGGGERMALQPGSRASARLEVFHADSAVLLPRACLLGDAGGRAAVLKLLEQGRVQRLDVAVAASGEEGVASTDANLAGARIACASPDILTRLLAGAPYVAADVTADVTGK
jgi:multidrug efflux pump subunit AcrA (membrane-fusion protein)